MKKKNEYLLEDEERFKEGKCVEDVIDFKIEVMSLVNLEYRCILFVLFLMLCILYINIYML